jgi:serpin B
MAVPLDDVQARPVSWARPHRKGRATMGCSTAFRSAAGRRSSARRSTTLVALLAALLLVVSAGCVGGSSPSASATLAATSSPPPGSASATPALTPSSAVGTPTPGLLLADVPRQVADPAQAAVAAKAINAFGLDLYRASARSGQNLVISPASIAIALSMARLGARGLTADQMDTVLHGLVANGAIDPLDALDLALAARNRTFTDARGVELPVALRITNATFAQQDLAIEQAYLDVLARGFGAGLRTVDFKADSEAARGLINDWVADQTEQRIKQLLARQDITSATRLVLVNAIYLKAAWADPFPEELTGPGAFTLSAGTKIQVPTMRATALRAYASGSGWQAVELPYIGKELAMTIVVPDDLAAFTTGLTADRFAQIVSALKPREVALTLPRFGFTTGPVDLSEPLIALGMPLAFSGEADFSGITTEERLGISAVIHEANIDVDEKGTEAAAATAVVTGDVGGPGPGPLAVHVDRPFLFALRDLKTGAVIFVGQVADPSASE